MKKLVSIFFLFTLVACQNTPAVKNSQIHQSLSEIQYKKIKDQVSKTLETSEASSKFIVVGETYSWPKSKIEKASL